MSMRQSINHIPQISQRQIYRLLQTKGSHWLKSHVLFADRQILVVNKPPNFVCQLSTTSKFDRRTTFLDPVFQDIKDWIQHSDPHPVHRLDKGTTGCLIFPLSHNVTKTISQQFLQNTVNKTYLALVHAGERAFRGTSGRIEDPIAYSDGYGRLDRKGKKAVTEWELVGSSAKTRLSLIRLKLLTGNKHQLRLHLAESLGAPILGDWNHSPREPNASLLAATMVPNNRIFLHSSEVSFFRYHNKGKRYRLGIRAPLPPDFKRICEDVDIRLPRHTTDHGVVLFNDEIIDEDLDEYMLWDPNRSY
ncbi:hypothetical protein M413DRAFT_445167 [Hebeloma cylindrosporum]|uniref:21S rRNA pseudouridine(2819) synthase n=1 Tax=Hebeloma cylindrosporum TaxID=76867 RepID=A0A0C3CCK1_HEBCY|nr:hypothetical protein M413DRAFT_445167 [Hebeloma cylindrosporum h7]